MKTSLAVLAFVSFVLPVACTTVNTTGDSGRRPDDTSVSRESTTVQQHPSGSTTIDQTKVTNR